MKERMEGEDYVMEKRGREWKRERNNRGLETGATFWKGEREARVLDACLRAWYRNEGMERKIMLWKKRKRMEEGKK